jgi:hypothetical protein
LLAAACGEESSSGGETQPAAQPKPAAQTQAPAQPAMTKGPKTIGFHTDWVSPQQSGTMW